MALVENRESIKRRLQEEAARQWGIEESDVKNGSFDPLVNLLFGALAVESEKIWHEMEASRSRIVKRMVETVLPEVVTGIMPAHSVMVARPASGTAEIHPTDQFSVQGNEQVCFSPAGSFKLSGAKVMFVATGARIDKIGASTTREQVIRLDIDKVLPPQTCWLGIEPADDWHEDEILLFINWPTLADRARYLSFTSSMQFFYEQKSERNQAAKITASMGIRPVVNGSGRDIPFFATYEKTARDYYHPHFISLSQLPLGDKRPLQKYPTAWEQRLEDAEKALFQDDLLWIKVICPASVTPDAMDRMEVTANCFPVLNRKLIRQRGKLQPLFNVYALTDEGGFLTIDRVVNGDGEELSPVTQKEVNKGQNVYALRMKNVARFDHRDALQNLANLTAHMRDDLAAFNILDNTILNTHLETISKGVTKLKEHIESAEHELPLIYLMVRTKSRGNMIDVYFWSSVGSKGNGYPAQTRLIPDSGNQVKTEAAVFLLPSSGGRDPMDDSQMQKAFREAILTRGKAVTIEDFRTIAKSVMGSAALNVEVKKSLSIGEANKEGVRRILHVNIIGNPAQKQTEEYWLKQAQEVKNTLEQRSTGVLPMFVSVEGYKWQL
jgi:hypothetical protein